MSWQLLPRVQMKMRLPYPYRQHHIDHNGRKRPHMDSSCYIPTSVHGMRTSETIFPKHIHLAQRANLLLWCQSLLRHLTIPSSGQAGSGRFWMLGCGTTQYRSMRAVPIPACHWWEPFGSLFQLLLFARWYTCIYRSGTESIRLLAQ